MKAVGFTAKTALRIRRFRSFSSKNGVPEVTAEYERGLIKKLGITDVDQACTLMKVLSEKDSALLLAKHEGQVKNMDLAFQNKVLQTELTLMTEKFLRAEGAMTARGVFEHTFEIFFLASGLKGRFNVTVAVHHAEKLLNEESEHPERTAELHPRVARTLELIKNADFPASKLASLYQRLSKDIHGRPWHGASVRLVLDDFDTAEQRLMNAIAEERGLTVEIVGAPMEVV